MPIIAWRVKPDLERVGHRDDLHDAGVGEALHALAHGGLGQPDALPIVAYGSPAVLLELLDDRLGDVVERRVPGCGSACAHPPMVVRGGPQCKESVATGRVNF